MPSSEQEASGEGLTLRIPAHIVADREELGHAKVPNGLALCKLHHAAFDGRLIGITPDSEIHVRDDLLTEKDGPMLEHGLRAFDGSRLNA